jgi:hypothetical protein
MMRYFRGFETARVSTCRRRECAFAQLLFQPWLMHFQLLERVGRLLGSTDRIEVSNIS